MMLSNTDLVLREYGFFSRKNFFSNAFSQLSSPFSMIKGMARCDLIVTNTFHGVMFCLISGTPFVALRNPNLVARLDNKFLKRVYDGSRLLDSTEQVLELINDGTSPLLSIDDFDYDALEEGIRNSSAFLKLALNV